MTTTVDPSSSIKRAYLDNPRVERVDEVLPDGGEFRLEVVAAVARSVLVAEQRDHVLLLWVLSVEIGLGITA